MPRISLYEKGLAEYVQNIMQGLSLEQAGIRTQLASETIRKMKLGKVPEPQTLRAFAEGFNDCGADYHRLMIICGYEEPTDLMERLETATRGRIADASVEILKAKLQELLELEAERSEEGNVTQ